MSQPAVPTGQDVGEAEGALTGLLHVAWKPRDSSPAACPTALACQDGWIWLPDYVCRFSCQVTGG